MAARTKARKRALDLLFEAEQRGLNARDLLAERLAKPVTEAPLNQYTADLVEGVVAHWTDIDELLATYSQGWTLERMPSVDRAILRLGAFEVLYSTEVPESVAIAEAVELATSLSTDDSPEVRQRPARPARRGQAHPGLSHRPSPSASPSPTDLSSVQGVEDGGRPGLRRLMDVSTWGSAPTGEERAAEPGFLLVAADGRRGCVGFAHVVEAVGPGGTPTSSRSRCSRSDAAAASARRCSRRRAGMPPSTGARRSTLRTFAGRPVERARSTRGTGSSCWQTEAGLDGAAAARPRSASACRVNGTRVAMVRPSDDRPDPSGGL